MSTSEVRDLMTVVYHVIPCTRKNGRNYLFRSDYVRNVP